MLLAVLVTIFAAAFLAHWLRLLWCIMIMDAEKDQEWRWEGPSVETAKTFNICTVVPLAIP